MPLSESSYLRELGDTPDINLMARDVLLSLNGAFKKRILYPIGHVIYQDALNSLIDRLSSFFTASENLALIVQRNTISHAGRVIHEGPMNEENLAFILFRDGIYYLAFKKTIESWEINSFLEILKNNQILTENAENDIVTALWELELPSLTYQAEDVGFDTGETFDIPELGYVESSGDLSDIKATNVIKLEQAQRCHEPVFNKVLWTLTSQDKVHLSNLVVEEKDWERIEYVLYILLYILQQQGKPKNFSEVMAYVNQELSDAMKSRKFHSVFSTLQVLNKTLNADSNRNHWARSLLEDFFESLSETDFLSVLQDDWAAIAACGSKELSYLKRSLLFMPPQAISTLGPMLSHIKSKTIKKILVSVMAELAAVDYEHMAKLASSTDTAVLASIIPVLGSMRNDRSLANLRKMVRHPSARVRRQALMAIWRRQPELIAELSFTLDDPDEGVLQLYLGYAGRQRNKRMEAKIREYLEAHPIRTNNKQYQFRMYRTLGKCGSDASLMFLKKSLFLLPIFNILRSKKSLKRQAAVHAITAIGTPSTESMLSRLAKRRHALERQAA
jgi:uncharacterized protein (UPF0147 family)